MSKSHKKRKARERATTSEGPSAAAEAPAQLKAPAALDEALLARVLRAVKGAGQPDGPGTWVYNGDTLSIKLVEGDATTPRRLLVAAFQLGVVFQVEGDRQVVRRQGDWPRALPEAPAT
jgi:hypothetical protein